MKSPSRLNAVILFLALFLFIQFPNSVMADEHVNVDTFVGNNPEEFNSLVAEVGEPLAYEIIGELLLIVSEFGAEEVLNTFLQDTSGSIDGLLHRVDIDNASADILAGALFKKITEEVLIYTFGPDVQAELITNIADDTVTVITLIAAAKQGTNVNPLASAVSLSVQTFFITRGYALSSYEEDENFKSVAYSLHAADQMRLAATEFEKIGDTDRAQQLFSLADNMIAFAVENVKDVFTGIDGEIVGQLISGMDDVIKIWRSGDYEGAQKKFEELYSLALEKHGGIANDFYERYFMLLRDRDTVRAFEELARVMNEIIEADGRVYNQIDWAQVKLFQGGALALISSNVSHIGSTAGSGSLPQGSSYNSGNDGLFVSASPLAETQWFLIVGDAAIHLGEHVAYGTIASPGGDPIISLNNAGVTNTVIEKYFTLPAGQKTFSFSTLADFVTTEFPEYVGTQFNDTGTITLITPAGATFNLTTIFSESVNASDFSPVSDLPPPMLKGTGEPTGGHTGFETASVQNLPVAPGGTVTLRIEVENVGDTLFPSAVLISGAEAR